MVRRFSPLGAWIVIGTLLAFGCGDDADEANGHASGGSDANGGEAGGDETGGTPNGGSSAGGSAGRGGSNSQGGDTGASGEAGAGNEAGDGATGGDGGNTGMGGAAGRGGGAGIGGASVGGAGTGGAGTGGAGTSSGGNGGSGGNDPLPSARQFCDQYQTDCTYGPTNHFANDAACLAAFTMASSERKVYMVIHVDNANSNPTSIHCTHAACLGAGNGGCPN